MDSPFSAYLKRVILYALLICSVPLVGLVMVMPNVFAANSASYTSDISKWLGSDDIITARVTFTFTGISTESIPIEMHLLSFAQPNCGGSATEVSKGVQMNVPGDQEQTRNIEFPVKPNVFTTTSRVCASFTDSSGPVNIPLSGTLRIDSKTPVRTAVDYYINGARKNFGVHDTVNAGTNLVIEVSFRDEGNESGLSSENSGTAQIRFGNGRWRDMSDGTVVSNNSKVRYSYTVASGDDGGLGLSLTGLRDNAGNIVGNRVWGLNSIEADEPDDTAPTITFPGEPEVERTYVINIADSQSGIYRYGVLKISGSEDAAACNTYDKVSGGETIEPEDLPREVTYSYTVPNALSEKICVYAEDYSGNIHSAASPAIVPQNVAPTLTIINDIPNTWARSHGFTVRLNDANQGDTLYLSYQQVETSAECLNNAVYDGTTPPTSFVVVPSPERGEEYTATFNTEDYSGKYACFAASDGKVTVVQVSTNAMKIDTTSPSLSVSGPASGAAQSKSITPTVKDINADAAGNRYVISGATCDETLIGSDGVGSAWTSDEAVVLRSEGYNGTHLCFRARDEAGNVSFIRSAQINGIDRTGPSITTTGPGEGAARQKTAHATIDATAAPGSTRFIVSSDACDESIIGNDTTGWGYASGSVITLNREDENGSYLCFRARDTLGNVSFARSAQIADIDRTNPVIGNIATTTSGHIYGDNKYAKAGNTIIATTMVSDENLTTLPTARIFSENAVSGTGMTVMKSGEQGYFVTYTVQSGDENRTPKKIHLEARDDAGNVRDRQTDIGVIIDTTAPVASATDYYINGTGDAARKQFDGVVTYLPVGSTLIIERRYDNEVNASGFSSHSAGLWKVKFGDGSYRGAEVGTVEGAAAGHVRYPYTIRPGDNGVLRWSVAGLRDNAGNVTPDATQEITLIEAKTTPPTLSNVQATTSNEVTTAAQAGDQITIRATVTDQLSFSDNAASRIAIYLDGEAVTGTPVVLSQDGTNGERIFQWIHTVVAGENGDLSFTIKEIADVIGNTIPNTTYAGGTDGYGNTITVDTTVPTITVTEAAGGTAQEKTVSARILDTNLEGAQYLISESSVCNESVMSASADSEPYASSRAIVLDDEAQDGSYVCFRAVDIAGNVSFARSAQVTGVDTTPPTISITEARSGVQREKGVSAIISADADTDGTRYLISEDDCDADLISSDDDGREYTSGDNIALDSEHYNEKYVCFRARDDAGNIAFARSSVITGVDRISPAVGNIHVTTTGITTDGVKYAKAGDIITGTVLIADSNLSALPEARIFSETATDGTAMTVNKIDSNNYTLTHTVRPDDEDNSVQKIFVWAQDDAENVGTGTGELGVVIDTAAPTISVTAIAAGGSREKTVSATINNADNNIFTSGTRYSISDEACDEDLIASDTSANSYTSDTDITLNDEVYNGQYACFRARDKAGNVVFARSAEIGGIDRTGPTISITHPGGVTSAKTLSATISADAVAAATRHAIIASGSCNEGIIGSDTEGERYVSGSDITLSDESYNGKYLCIRARDAVGNISFARSEIIAGIDRTNPVIGTVSITTDSAYEGAYYANVGDVITATFSVSDTNLSGLPTVRIFSENSTLGKAMQVTDNDDGTYTATYPVFANDESRLTQRIYLEARDAAGNISGRGVDIEVTIDTVNPVISVGSLAAGVAQAKTLSAEITDRNIVTAGARYVISESACDADLISDNSDGNAYISGADINLNNEQHNGKYVCFRARDVIGNISFARSSVITGIDQSAPTISIIGLATGAAREKTVTATITDANPVSVGSRYAIASENCDADLIGDDAEGTAYTSGEEIALNSELQNGQYICFRARDAAGNVRFARSSVIDDIDRTAPTFGGVTMASSGSSYAGAGDVISVSAVIADEHLGTNPTVRIFSSGSTGGESIPVSRGANDTYTGTYTITVGDENRSPQRIYLQAVDDAGNTDAWTSDITVAIDTTGPSITVTEAATGAARTKTVSATITDSSTTETKYRIADEDCDADLFVGFNAQTYQSRESITLDDEAYNGQHVCFRASDSAGNVSFARSAQITGIDRTGPTITVNNPSTNTAQEKVISASIAGTTVAAGSRYAITTEDCDSDLISSDTDGTSYTSGNTINLDREEYNGQHVCFRARDAVGNVSFTQSARIDGIDRISPTISITEPTSGAALQKSISAGIEDIHLIAVGSRYAITAENCDSELIGSDTEGTAYTSGESIILDDEAYNGQHVCFRARDTVNNITFARSAQIVGIDRTGPVVTVTNPTTGRAQEKTISAAIAGDAAIAGSRYIISAEDCDAGLIGSDTEGTAYTSGEEITLNSELQNRQYVCFRARDALGNVSFTQSAQITSIDRTGPAISVTDPAAGTAREKLVSAVITGGAVIEDTRYRISASACDAALIGSNTDGETYVSGTNITLDSESYNGQYVCFRARDAASNVSFARSAQITDIDRTGPVISVVDPEAGTAREKTVSAVMLDKSGTTGDRYTISTNTCDASLIGSDTDGQPYILDTDITLDDESYNGQYVCFRSADTVGNVSFARSAQITGIDRTGPVLSITDPAAGNAREKAVSALIIEEASSQYIITDEECDEDIFGSDTEGAEYTSGENIALDDETYNGQHICFRSSDDAGNTSFAQSSQITSIDRTAPTIRVVDPALGDAREKLVSAVITGNAVTEGTRYRITASACDATLIDSDTDGESYTSGTNITLDSETYNGQYVCFRARDAVDNVSFARSAQIADIDRTGPTITVSDPSAGAAQAKSVSATITNGAITTETRYVIASASCDESLIGSSAAGSPYISGATITLNNESYNGQYACFRSADLVGNTSFARSAQITGIDRAGPVISVTNPAAGTAREKTVSAAIAGDAAAVGSRYALSNSTCDATLISTDTAGEAYTSGTNITLDNESYNGRYVCFRARDAVGNVSFTRSAQIAGIDRTAPAIQVADPPLGDAQEKSVSAVITGDAVAGSTRYRVSASACDATLIGSDTAGTAYTSGESITLDNEVYNGQYVCFRARDIVNNVVFARSAQITGIDQTSPSITVNNPSTNIAREKVISATITDGASSTNTRYVISSASCDESLIGNSSTGKPYTSGAAITLDDEAYNEQYVCFRSADLVGNVSFARSAQITGIDQTSPVITILGPSIGRARLKLVSASVTGLPADAGTQYALSSGSCDSGTISGDSDGTDYTIGENIVLDEESHNGQYVCFRARDEVGNIIFARSEQITDIDRTGPVIAITGPTTSRARTKTVSATFTGNVSATSGRYRFADEDCDEDIIESSTDGEPYTSGTDITLDRESYNGQYVCFRSADTVGNVSFERSRRITGIDRDGPTITVNNPAAGTSREKVVSAVITDESATADTRYAISAGICDTSLIASSADGQPYTSGEDITLDGESYNGRYVCFRAIDEVGNSSFVRSAQITGIDRSSPIIIPVDTARILTPADPEPDTPQEDTATVETVDLDAEDENQDVIPNTVFNAPPIPPQQEDEQEEEIDRTPPTITPFGPEPGPAWLKIATANISGLAVESGNRYVITDGACDESVIATDTDGNQYISGRSIVLNDEAHNGSYICYRARDAAGNVSFARSPQINGIDTAGPTIEVADLTTEPAFTKSISATITGDADVTKNRYSISGELCDFNLIRTDTDGEPYTSGTDITLDDEAYNGQYVCFRTRDEAGNVSFVRSAQITGIDRTGPTITLSGPTPKPARLKTVSASITDLPVDTGSRYVITDGTCDETVLDSDTAGEAYTADTDITFDDESYNGQYVCFRARDEIGNISFTQSAQITGIDTTPPLISEIITNTSGTTADDVQYAKAGDTITLVFSESDVHLNYTLPLVRIFSGTNIVGTVLRATGTPDSYTVTYTVQPGDENRPQQVSITAADMAGNVITSTQQLDIVIETTTSDDTE